MPGMDIRHIVFHVMYQITEAEFPCLLFEPSPFVHVAAVGNNISSFLVFLLLTSFTPRATSGPPAFPGDCILSTMIGLEDCSVNKMLSLDAELLNAFLNPPRLRTACLSACDNVASYVTTSHISCSRRAKFRYSRMHLVQFECPRVRNPLVLFTFGGIPFPHFQPLLLPLYGVKKNWTSQYER